MNQFKQLQVQPPMLDCVLLLNSEGQCSSIHCVLLLNSVGQCSSIHCVLLLNSFEFKLPCSIAILRKFVQFLNTIFLRSWELKHLLLGFFKLCRHIDSCFFSLLLLLPVGFAFCVIQMRSMITCFLQFLLELRKPLFQFIHFAGPFTLLLTMWTNILIRTTVFQMDQKISMPRRLKNVNNRIQTYAQRAQLISNLLH